MIIKDVDIKEKDVYNNVVTHPLQSFEWGEFRKKTGIKIIRKGFLDKNKIASGFQLSIHKIPHVPWTIGYLPKIAMPTNEIINELEKIGVKENCIFIQLEPNIKKDNKDDKEFFTLINQFSNIVSSAHPLFTRYTFELDLTKSEEELLKKMHYKTRYNIKLAEKHGVKIIEDSSEQAFNNYLDLVNETTKRQQFYAHSKIYHQLMWETLKVQSSKFKIQNLDQNNLTAHLFIAEYQPNNKQQSIVLVAWILFSFHDTLYYPYGASSSQYREVMASNLMMWEAIKFGKKIGLKKFDMWGSLGLNPNKKDVWYGFHRFKEGYGGKLIEFVGSYDLVINPSSYRLFKVTDKIRWSLLKLRKMIS